MNKYWAELQKEINTLLKKKDTFNEGKNKLLELRKSLFETVTLVYSSFPKENWSIMPFMNSKGYDSKSMAYSIYHISRIEDIVVNTLILNKEEIYFSNDYKNKMNSSIITTGNELVGKDIELFSNTLDIDSLIDYFKEVYFKDNEYIKSLEFNDIKKSFTQIDKNRIINKHVVSSSEDANWLIDYWGNKNVLGLISMPLSRHWIMHIEAFLRIKNKIDKMI